MSPDQRRNAAARPTRTRPTVNQPKAGGSSARARLAAERAQAEQRRRRLWWVALPVAVVVLVAAVLIAVRLTTGPRSSSGPAASQAQGSVIAGVTGVPAAVLDQIGAGQGTTPPRLIDAPALTADGKPRILYVGAEYCPYCAAERWAIVVALSRFGTFSGLGQTASSSRLELPSTPTLTFHGASYTSSTLSFTGVETESNEIAGNQYAPLDTLSPQDQKLFDTYDSPPYVDARSQGSIPFVLIGGRYLISGASYNAELLQGRSHEEIATALSDPKSPIAQGVDGAANLITAAICRTTNNAPSAVCDSAGVKAAGEKLQ